MTNRRTFFSIACSRLPNRGFVLNRMLPSAIFGFPLEIGRTGNRILAADFGDRSAVLDLLQNANNLMFTKLTFHHCLRFSLAFYFDRKL